MLAWGPASEALLAGAAPSANKGRYTTNSSSERTSEGARARYVLRQDKAFGFLRGGLADPRVDALGAAHRMYVR